MNDKDDRHWFAAKRYGFGWSYPVTWQGWLVVAVYFVLLVGGIAFLRARPGVFPVGAWVAIVTFALIVIVIAKGERPLKWRWGRGETRR